MSLDTTSKRVRDIVSQQVVVGSLDPTVPIRNYLDSVAILEVLLDSEEEFGILIADDLLGGDPLSLEGLCREIHQRVEESGGN